MSLIMTRRIGEGFSVGDHVLYVKRVAGPESCTLGLVGGDNADVTDKKATEVAPEVFVSIGSDTGWNDWARLCIDAPRSLKITRLSTDEITAKLGNVPRGEVTHGA